MFLYLRYKTIQMKKTLTLLSLAALPFSLAAQITLNQSSFASWSASTDSLKSILPTAVASLGTGANMSWDLSSNAYIPVNYTIPRGTGTSPIPGGSFSSTQTIAISTGMNLTMTTWSAITSSGIQMMGDHMERQGFFIGLVTGGLTDSLVFPTQNVVYSAPRTVLAFPATDGTVWTNSYDQSIAFTITATGLGWNNEPGVRKTYVIQDDSVKGWGKMKVKTTAGGASAFMDVLQVKTHANFIDSFYLNGSPIPDAQLSALGLGQGMETDVFTTSYYRAGEVTPLLTVTYTDGSYSTPSSAMVHTQRLNTVGVNDIHNTPRYTVYPNPANGNTIRLALPDANGDYSFRLTSPTGQLVGTGILKTQGNEGIVTTTGGAAGTYVLSVYRNGVSIGTTMISMF